jgi:hypothetical protein
MRCRPVEEGSGIGGSAVDLKEGTGMGLKMREDTSGTDLDCRNIDFNV